MRKMGRRPFVREHIAPYPYCLRTTATQPVTSRSERKSQPSSKVTISTVWGETPGRAGPSSSSNTLAVSSGGTSGLCIGDHDSDDRDDRDDDDDGGGDGGGDDGDSGGDDDEEDALQPRLCPALCTTTLAARTREAHLDLP